MYSYFIIFIWIWIIFYIHDESLTSHRTKDKSIVDTHLTDQSIFIFASQVHILYLQYVNKNETQAQNIHAHRK